MHFDTAETHLAGHHHDPDLAFDEHGDRVRVTNPDLAALIDESNNWREPGQLDDENQRRFEDAANLLGAILGWLSQADSITAAGLRAWSLVIAVRPDLLRSARSQSALAKELGVTKAAVSKYVSAIWRLAHGTFQSGLVKDGIARQRSREATLGFHRGDARAPKKINPLRLVTVQNANAEKRQIEVLREGQTSLTDWQIAKLKKALGDSMAGWSSPHCFIHHRGGRIIIEPHPAAE